MPSRFQCSLLNSFRFPEPPSDYPQQAFPALGVYQLPAVGTVDGGRVDGGAPLDVGRHERLAVVGASNDDCAPNHRTSF